MEPSYRRIVHAVSETPWAILPSKLAAILEMISLRLEGYKLSEDEIRERIGAARPSRSAAGHAAGGSVAVLPLYGVIAPKANLMSQISGGTSLEQFVADFRQLVGDEQVGTIVLDVDSPGGAVDLVPEAAAEIRAARSKKQIVAVANTTAASAALWLAVQADEFIVTPSGEAGSIGVFAAHEDISALQEKMGVKTTLISAGEHKTEGNPFEPLSADARAAIQKTVDHFYGLFVSDVAKGRGVDEQTVEDRFGQGRMLTAADAVKAGLADRVETLDQTLARLTGGNSTSQRTRRAEATESVIDLAALAARAPSVTSIVASGEHFAPGATPTVAITSSAADLAASPAHTEPASAARASSTTRPKGSSMFASIEELVARQDEIKARQQEIDSEYPTALLPPDLDEEFKALDEEWATLAETVKDIERRKAALATKVDSDTPGTVERGDKPTAPMTSVGRRVPDNIYALEEYRSRASGLDELATLYTDGAKRAIDASSFPHPRAKREDVQAHIERLLAKDSERGDIARRILATGSPAYDRAFGKMVLGRQLNQQDRQALEMMANTPLNITNGADGGYAIPYTLDPTIVPTSNGAVNPFRALGRNITITGNLWKGVASDGVSVAYEAEATEVGATDLDLAQPEINVEKAQLYIQFSIEAGEDWAGMRGELATMIQDAKDAKEADKFANGAGHGSDEPEGLIAKLDAEGSSEVPTATADTFVLDDLYALDDDLPPRFEPNASVVANKAVYNAIRSLSGDQFDVWMPLAQGPARGRDGSTGRELLGYRAWRASEMDSDVTTTGQNIVCLGDFRYFAVVDRVGLNIELVPHVFGTGSNRPTGQRALYGYFRNSSGVLSVKAFRLLQVA